MSESRTPAGGAAAAEAMKKRLEEIEKEKSLGAGNQEADPATAANPPSDVQAGDEKREQT